MGRASLHPGIAYRVRISAPDPVLEISPILVQSGPTRRANEIDNPRLVRR